jgi:hypothetical protein
MEKMLLLLLCLPMALRAQQPKDTVIKQTYLFDNPLRTVRVKNDELIIKPVRLRQLTIAGTYTAAAALKTANAAPENNILHTGNKLSHSLYVKAGIQKDDADPLWILTLNTGQGTENLILPNNNNTGNHLDAAIQRFLGKHLTLSGGYSTNTSRFTNSNLDGFLNHVYENALLTAIGAPSIPLNSPGHGEQIRQNTGFLAIRERSANLNVNITTAINAVDNKINQQIQRNQHNTHYNTDANATYTLRYPGYRWISTARLHLLHNTDEVNITYPAAGSGYAYTRTADDGELSFATIYYYENTNTGLTVGDKFYNSTTSTKNSLGLPELSAFIHQSNIMQGLISARLAGTYSAFYSEPALNRSWSPYLLTLILPQASATFAPIAEVASLKGLSPIMHQEYTSKLELTFWYWLTASADLSLRTSKDNPYPLFTNNQLTLQNLADIRYKGLELSLTQTAYRRRPRQLTIDNSISFWRYTNTVTNIAAGLDSIPIAGFANVHNTLIKGQPLGVITGNTYHSNSAIIGNPTPDFTLKFSHLLSWQRLSLNTDWQYVKGGDVWNGTRAVLDYYSETTHPGLPRSYTGVAEAYIQKGDNIRINLLSLAYTIPLKRPRQQIRLLAYAENIILWSAYPRGDPQQRLFDQPDASGLDFFNLPSPKSYGINASIQL